MSRPSRLRETVEFLKYIDFYDSSTQFPFRSPMLLAKTYFLMKSVFSPMLRRPRAAKHKKTQECMSQSLGDYGSAAPKYMISHKRFTKRRTCNICTTPENMFCSTNAFSAQDKGFGSNMCFIYVRGYLTELGMFWMWEIIVLPWQPNTNEKERTRKLCWYETLS